MLTLPAIQVQRLRVRGMALASYRLPGAGGARREVKPCGGGSAVLDATDGT